MKPSLHFSACPLLLAMLAGCASQDAPPVIALDEPVEAQRLPEPPKPIEVVEMPKPLALPAQLKPLPDALLANRSRSQPMSACVCRAPTATPGSPQPGRATSTPSRSGPTPMERCIRCTPARGG